MKAIVLNITYVLIMAIVIMLLGISLSMQIPNARGYITSALQPGSPLCGRIDQGCCSKNWCDEGLKCSGGTCVEFSSLEIGIYERYLIYNASETNSRTQRDEYLNDKSGLGWGDCSDATNCIKCSKLSNFQSASSCMDCSLCDAFDDTCKNCLSCASAEGGKYNDLNQCYDCWGCTGINNDMADGCSGCTYCNVEKGSKIY